MNGPAEQTAQSDSTLPRPVVGDEHVCAPGSAAALSILRDLCFEAGSEGRVSTDEAYYGAICYARLAAWIGGPAEAVALATLLTNEANEAAKAGAEAVALNLRQEAVDHLTRVAEAGDDDAARLCAAIVTAPGYRDRSAGEQADEEAIADLFREGARGDQLALAAMVDGSLQRRDQDPLRSLTYAFLKISRSALL